MAISDYGAGLLLEKCFGATNFTPPANWFVGFRGAGVELSGGGYARISVANNTTQWPATSTDVISNGAAIVTPTASADWDEADEVVLWDASSGGNEWFSQALDAPFTLLSGRSRSFAAGALRIRLL